MQPNPNPAPTSPPEPPPATATPKSPDPPATVPTSAPPTPPPAVPNALVEMPPRANGPPATLSAPPPAEEKDLHEMPPRAVTMFGVQCVVFGHAIVARADFSGIFLDHEDHEIRLATKSGVTLTTGLSPNVFAEFVLAQREQTVIVPGAPGGKEGA